MSSTLLGTIGVLLLAVGALMLCPAAAGQSSIDGSDASANSNSQATSTLTASTVRATAVTLNWEAFDDSESSLAGYNIYRRKEGQRYPLQPSGFTGVRDEEGGTRYVADRLEPGTTYFFKVLGRNENLEEVGSAREVTVTTSEEKEGTYRYMTLKVAVVIYKNANHRNGGDHQTPDRLVEDYKLYLNKARDFIWRNTNMKLNIDFTYYPIEEYVEMDNRAFQSVNTTGRHLQEMFGVMNTQYDFVFRLTPSVGGYYSLGATNRIGEAMSGPDRRTGFAQLQLPLPESGYGSDPYEYGDQVSKRVNNLIWLFIHEGQHVLDGIYRYNAHPEFGHGDRPQQYNASVYSQVPESLRFGKRYDFQSALFRTFDPEDFSTYLDLDRRWGVVREVRDADGDGLPDKNSRVPVSEKTFGSDTTSADTDGDGLSDKAEATDGIYPYSASNPNDSDTDSDNTPDGDDRYPRYNVSQSVMKAGGFRPTIDGDVSEWPEKASISQGVFHKTEAVSSFDPTVYSTYARDSLYIALELPRSAVPMMRFDFDADGRWYGIGNTEIVADVVDEGLERIRTYDASIDGRSISDNGVWDTNSEYQQEFGRVYTLNSTQGARIRFDVQRRDEKVAIEMAFPETRRGEVDPRLNNDIVFDTGDKIGFRLDYSAIGGSKKTLTRALEKTLSSGMGGAFALSDNHRSGPKYHTPASATPKNQAGTVRADNARKAETFDKWSYVYFTLGDKKIEEGGGSAEETAINSVYPNPFTGTEGTVTINYSVAQRGNVEIAVYDMLGRRVKTLKNEETRPGSSLQVRWDGTRAGGEPVASGLYFVRMETPSGTTHTSRMIITR
ncbi:MAG: T9SS type A sorting domain-containing protein [Salinibacter sp.]|uniref:T9SS type A sorting domain-containing protein n=1 Tax=Salinibacter sp. TaxID=2065818 RepID=UPI0035D3DFFD